MYRQLSKWAGSISSHQARNGDGVCCQRSISVSGRRRTVPVGIARIERVLMELSMLIAERPGLPRKAWKTSEPLWEKPLQDQDVVASLPEGSLGLLMMNYHLGNQSFVPKAIGS